MRPEEQTEIVPVAFWVGSVPIPDLKQIPEDRWRPLLRQIPAAVRGKAIDTAAFGRFGDVARAVGEVDQEEHERRGAASVDWVAFPPPLPGGAGEVPKPRARQRQVAFRLYRPQYDDLDKAAKKLGLKPAQLARLLTLRGVAQVLAEAG